MNYSWTIKYLTEGIGMAFIIVFVNLATASIKSTKTKGRKFRIAAIYGVGMCSVTMGFSMITGSIFNPAYTLGLAASNLFTWDQTWKYLLAQLLGAVVGQLIVVAIQYENYRKMDDATDILRSFAIINDLDNRTYERRGAAMVQGAITEFFTSFVFFFITTSFVNYYIQLYISQASQQGGQVLTATNPETIQSAISYTFGPGSFSSLVLGLLVFGIVATTNVSLNPFRDLGPRLVHYFLPKAILGDAKDDSRWWYAWVPVVMPVLAAITAVALFKIMYLK